MIIAVVGSRRRNTVEDREQINGLIREYMDRYGDDLVVVSGGCPKGADKFAADSAKANKINLVEFPAILHATANSLYRQAYYARNKTVAEFCDRLFAQVAPDRKGGTEDTIKKAHSAGKSVYLLTKSGQVQDKPDRPEGRIDFYT